MCDFATQIREEEILFRKRSFSDQTNTCGESLRGGPHVHARSCLYECYSATAAIITGARCALVCLSLCVPFSCPLRNADYRLDLVTVQQCDDVAQNVSCRRLCVRACVRVPDGVRVFLLFVSTHWDYLLLSFSCLSVYLMCFNK